MVAHFFQTPIALIFVIVPVLILPPKYTKLLFGLEINPEATENILNLLYKQVTELTSPLKKRSKSSANPSRIRSSLVHLGWYLNIFSSLSVFINLQRYYMASTNRNGDKGLPCLSLFFASKGLMGTPLIRIE